MRPWAEHARLTAALAQAAPAAALEELKKEGELLLLQLHQVQEELEHYYLSNRRLDDEAHQHAQTVMRWRRLWARNQPSDVVIDLREPIDGSNWHEAEQDGRWTGPGTTSTLQIPAMLPGTYSIQLDLLDAISPEVTQGIKLALNGRELPIDGDALAAPGLVICAGAASASDGDDWILTMSVPFTRTPRELGIEDDRPLGVRVSSIAFTLLDPLAQQ